METVLTAILVYISTSIDFLVVLTILFATQGKRYLKSVYFGQYLGTAILVAVSLLAAYFLNFIPQEWIIGLFGLIPIALGVMAIFVDEDFDEDELEEKVQGQGSKVLAFTGLTLTLGGDELGIYIPYFIGKTVSDILIILIIFAFGVFVLLRLSESLASVNAIEKTIEKYEKIIVPVVFIGLGLYILIDNGTFTHLFSLVS